MNENQSNNEINQQAIQQPAAEPVPVATPATEPVPAPAAAPTTDVPTSTPIQAQNPITSEPVQSTPNAGPVLNGDGNATNEQQTNNLEGKVLKNSSQMIWLFLGSYIACDFAAYFISEILNALKITGIAGIIFKLSIAVGFYYFTVKLIFRKNALYKRELKKI